MGTDEKMLFYTIIWNKLILLIVLKLVEENVNKSTYFKCITEETYCNMILNNMTFSPARIS